LSTTAPTGGSIPDPRPGRRLRLLVAVALLALLAGCAQVRSRLPQRTPPPARPPATVPAKPRPAPAGDAPARTSGFAVVPPAQLERERTRLRQALAADDSAALAPREAGYYLDVLQGRLRQVAGRRSRVSRQGNRLVLDLSRGVGFAPGAASLGPGGAEVVGPLGRLFAEYGRVVVTVRVSPVDAASNNSPQLALSRALMLAQHFADAGVAKRRLVVVAPGAGATPGGARVVVEVDPVVRRAAAKPAK
jgi:hypothetical protein